MPAYRRKIRCAYADPPKPKKAPKPKKDMTEDEKDEAFLQKLVNKAVREKKRAWEATLVPAIEREDFMWPDGTKGLFPSDAKKLYHLNPKEMATLKRENIQSSPISIVRLEDVVALAKRKHEAIEEYPPFMPKHVDYDMIHTRHADGKKRSKAVWGIASSSYRRY